MILVNDIHDIHSYKDIYIVFIMICVWIPLIDRVRRLRLSLAAFVSYHEISSIFGLGFKTLIKVGGN